MNREGASRLFTGAYSRLRSTGILDQAWAKRAFVSSYFLYKRLWEDPFRAAIRARPELVGDGDVLDIGANIGYTACVFAEALKPNRRVYAFEPDAAAFATLQEVVGRKRLAETIVPVNAAVGAGEGTVEFWHNKDHAADHRVATEHFKAAHADAVEVSRVPMVSVDGFVSARGIERVAFIKIDVQGFEPAVCEGMVRTLERFPAAPVCCEYSPGSFAELGLAAGALLDFFASRGFTPRVLSRSGVGVPLSREQVQRAAEEAGYVDLLYTKDRKE